MARRKQEVPASPVLEVLVTFRSGATTTVHMTEQVFTEFFDSVDQSFLGQDFFCPAPDYHSVYLRHESIDSAVIMGTVVEGDDYGDDEDQGPASTD
jgi:hypothetical protein